MGNLNFIVGKPLLEVKSTATGEVYIPPVTLTVSFNSNGGDAPSFATKKVMHTATYGTLPQVTRTNYKFKGWYTSASGGSLIDAGSIVNNASNHTLYAQWIPRFLVTFQYKDESGVDQTYLQYVFQGENANPPDVPNRAYWRFNGWTTSFLNIQNNITTTAWYIPEVEGYYIFPTSTVSLGYGGVQSFSVYKRDSSLPTPTYYNWQWSGGSGVSTITGNVTSAFKITNNNTTALEFQIGSISVEIDVDGWRFNLSFDGVVNLLREVFTITTYANFANNSALNYTISTQQVFRGVTPVIPEPIVEYWYNSYTDPPNPATQNTTYNVYYAVDTQQFDSPLITSNESPMGTANFTVQNTNDVAVSVSYTIYTLVNYERALTVKSGTFPLAGSTSTVISHIQNTNTYLEIEVEFKYSGVSVGAGTKTQWVQIPFTPADSFLYTGSSGAYTTTLIYDNRNKSDFNTYCPAQKSVTDWLNIVESPSNYSDGDIIRIRSKYKCPSGGVCYVDPVYGQTYSWCAFEYRFTAITHKWQYITYVSSEPEYGTYSFITYNAGATTQTQAKNILDATYPPGSHGLGTTGVITPDYTIFWIFEVVRDA